MAVKKWSSQIKLPPPPPQPPNTQQHKILIREFMGKKYDARFLIKPSSGKGRI
jgi:hypothetical protein